MRESTGHQANKTFFRRRFLGQIQIGNFKGFDEKAVKIQIPVK